MKFGKIALGVIVVVIVAVAATVYYGLSNINSLVKTAIEQEAPKITGTNVKLNAVDIKLTDGRGELHGLTIANPKGYTSDYAFTMGEIALQIDPKSVVERAGDASKVIVINEILIDGAKLIAEQKELTKTNLQDLLNSVKRNTQSASSSGTSGSDTSAASEKDGPEVLLMVEKFRFVNSDIRLITEQWGERTLNMPAIEENNIGSKNAGLTPEQLGQVLANRILTTAKNTVSSTLKQMAREKAEAKLKEKLDEQLDDAQKEQVDKLKGLFGN